MKPLDIIIPVYNEEVDIVRDTIAAIRKAVQEFENVKIIVVNDGSDASFGLDALKSEEGLKVIRHKVNRGYGAALKTGILSGSAPWIAITDADGTYPVDELPSLLPEMEDNDMVIGIRTGQISQIPLLRRFPKKVLNLLASYMADVPIKDLNSGMRVFSRRLCYYLWPFYPNGFSFTSTITMGAHMGGFRVAERPINYYKRMGDSSIRPIRDTYRFFRLVFRLGLVFYPMKLFGPVAIGLFFLGALKAFFVDYLNDGFIGNLALMTMLVSIQIVMMGLLGKLIVHSRMLSPAHVRPENIREDDPNG